MNKTASGIATQGLSAAREKKSIRFQEVMRRYRSDIVCVVLAFACVALFFHQPLTKELTFFFRDLFHWTYPVKHFFTEEVTAGRIPLWNPYLNKGIPYAANPASSIYYPCNILFLLPFPVGLKYFLILHYLLLALFTYLFLRNRALSSQASMVGALTFALSGYILFLHSQSVFLQSAVWLPLNLFLFSRSLSTNGQSRWIILNAAGIAIQFFAGNPQDVLICLLCMLALGLQRLIDSRRSRSVTAKAVFKSLVGVGGLSGGLAAIQLLPAMELALLSTRASGLPLSEAVYYSFHPFRLIELLLPLPFGTLFPLNTYWGQFLLNSPFNIPWTLHAYLGILPLYFITLALTRNSKNHRVCVLLAALFLLLSFGKHTPVFGFFFHIIPGFSLFRYPEKYLLPTTLFLATLCAVGYDTLLSLARVRRRFAARPCLTTRHTRLLATYAAVEGFASLFLASVTLAYLVFLRFDSALPRLLHWMASLWGLAHFPPGAVATLLQSFNHLVVVGLISCMTLYTCRKYGLGPRRCTALVVLVQVADLFFANRTLITYTSYRIYEATPPLVETLKAHAESDHTPYRIFRAPMKYSGQYESESLPYPTYERQRWWDKNTLVMNIATVYRFSYVDAYESADLRDYLDFLNSLDHNLNRLLSVLNVRYVIAPLDDPAYSTAKGYTLLTTMPREGIALLKNEHCYERAFVVPEARYYQKESDLLAAITQNDFDFRTTVALNTPPPPLRPDASPGGHHTGQCTTLEYTPCSVKIFAKVDIPSYLVLSDTYYPGWKAWVDGTQQPILKANYVMRALSLQPGRHLVEFRYDPASFKLGLALSLLTLALTALLLAGAYRNGCRNALASKKLSLSPSTPSPKEPR